MFAKAFISPKNSTPKSFLHTSDSLRSPKVRESYMRSTATNKSKHNGNSEHRDSFCTKEISHLDNESLLSTQIGSNSNLAIEAGPSLSIITEVAGGGRDGSSAAYFNEKYCKKVLEEMHALRQELEQKNGVITKLSKENDNLRREMEEFLTAVDDAREYIDVELKECNQRIQDLENEIHEVREENKQYKKELEKRGNEVFPSQKEIAGLLQQEVDGFFAVSQKDTEDFYFKLNEQIAEFLGNSKEKYQDFSKNIQHKIQNAKKETAVKIEQPKPSKVIPNQTSPLRSLKQSHNPSRGRIQSPKASQSMSLAKKSSKKNLDNFLSLTNEISSPTSYGLYNASPGHASIRQFDKQYEESTNFLSDFDKLKRNSYLASPSKSALLRTKLKSDAILIEMKKKLAGL